jgi:hypothetical protein
MKRVQAAVQNNDLNVAVNTAGAEPLPLMLKLERIGGVGYRGWVSTDGGATFRFQSHTIPSAGNALRDAAVGLQVGLAYQNFGTLAGTSQFDDFILDIHDPLPAPGAAALSTSQSTFVVPPGAVIQQLITDTTSQGFLEWVRTPNLPGTDGMFPSGLGPAAPVLIPPVTPAPSNGSVFYWNTTGRPVGEMQTIMITATNDWGQVSEPLTLTVRIVSSGDFDSDGGFDCDDIDALVEEIVVGTNQVTFDMTGDNLVDLADRDAWLAAAGVHNLPSGNPYLPGDANLDGIVDGSDFGVWNANKFTNVAAWCSGDFTADGVVDGSDFGIWNANKFTSSDAATVPEPATASYLMALVLAGQTTTRMPSHARWRFICLPFLGWPYVSRGIL